MNFRLLVPAHDPPAAVKVERPFECETFCAHKGIIPIGLKAVLHKCKIRLELLIQLSGLFCVPEHVVVAPCQDLASGQLTDILQIQFTFRKIPSPTVIPDQDKRVLIRYQLAAVLPELFFMIFPYAVMQLPRCSQHRLIMQMQIADCVQTHSSSPYDQETALYRYFIFLFQIIQHAVFNHSFQLHSSNYYPRRNPLIFCKLKYAILRIIFIFFKHFKIFK